MLQAVYYDGNNLEEVIRFTGKSEHFRKYFSSWKEYEDYVRSHGNTVKLWNRDGSHLTVKPGSWIVRLPEGGYFPVLTVPVNAVLEYEKKKKGK